MVKLGIDLKALTEVFDLLERCTDDYLFVLDFMEDHYIISERAKERFLLEEADFYNASEHIIKCVYPDDRDMLNDDLEKLKNGSISEHNLEYRWMDKEGKPVWISCRGQLGQDDDGNVRYLIGRISEIGKQNKIDSVTGLYKERKLREKLAEVDRSKVESGFFLLIGIDNFKEINEKHGKAVGDNILYNTVKVIKEQGKDYIRAYRMKGDEVMIYCENPPEWMENPGKDLYDNIRSGVDDLIAKDGYKFFYTISGGVVSFGSEGVGIVELIGLAEFALHKAKLTGKNTCVTYSREEYDNYLKRLDMQECLRKSSLNNFEGFELFYQPIVNVKEKKIYGAEALLRWHHERFGRVSPAEFIPLLEESGLIIPVGRWIIETAMAQCQEWQKRCPGFRININLSFVQLKKSDVIRDIDLCLEKLNIESCNVLFEVTESGELDDGGYTQRILQSFRKRSLNLAIDDFGTGYSNLRYIKEMMFDMVKIDQAFIRNIQNSQYDYLVVKQFTELAHLLDMQVCYEGVETAEDLKCVLELSPDYIQGYYFAKPVPVGEFEDKYLGRGVRISENVTVDFIREDVPDEKTESLTCGKHNIAGAIPVKTHPEIAESLKWYDKAVFYHIYPLGLCGCARENTGVSESHFGQLNEWADHAKKIGCTAVYIGPLFESVGHGYETTDYKKVDCRLGTNDDFKSFVRHCHEMGVHVIVDGVFNHVGREFFAFKDLKEKREGSAYRDWFCNVNFYGNNEFGDGFSYENWGGYNLLVKLNQKNQDVKNYLFDVIRFWVSEFDIDGIRLDAADVLDFDFMREMRCLANEVKDDFWLMGEVIHGDYSRWVNDDTLHSVTNYELHKGIFSGHNDHNYFEIAHSIKRLNDICRQRKLYIFADNHDVARIASKLNNPAHLIPVTILLYTVYGIPSVYYGSEFGIEGDKQRESDWNLRPYIDLEEKKSDYEENNLTKLCMCLGYLKQSYTELNAGSYVELLLTNRQFAFGRVLDDSAVITVLNNDDIKAVIDVSLPCKAVSSLDLIKDYFSNTGDFRGEVKSEISNGKLHVELPANCGTVIYIH